MKNKTKRIAASAMAFVLLGTGGEVSQIVSPSTSTGITASATDSFGSPLFSTVVERLEKKQVIEGVTIPTGSLKVSLVLTTPQKYSGYGPSGVRVPYNSILLDVVTKSDGSYLLIKGDSSDELTSHFAVNVDAPDINPITGKKKRLSGILSMGTMGDEVDSDDGIIFTVYLKAKPGKNITNEPIYNLVDSPEVERFLSPDCTPIEYEESSQITYLGSTPPKDKSYIEKSVIDYQYCFGDLNGDGNVNTADAQCIILLLKDRNTKEINTTNAAQLKAIKYDEEKAYKGIFVERATTHNRELLLKKIADVNNDNLINMHDAEIILDYYSDVVVSGNKNNPYNLNSMVEKRTKSFVINKT